MIPDYSSTEPYGTEMIRSLLLDRIDLRRLIVFNRNDPY
jgi:hypothetical protein